MNVFDDVRRSCRRAIVYPAAFSLVLNVLALTIPLYMMQVYDRVLGSRNTDTLLFLTLIGIGALLAFAALDWVRARMLVRIGNWVERSLAPEAFARALEAQLQGYPYRGEALQDIAQLRNFLTGPTLLCFFDAPWSPIYLLVIFLLHPALGAVALAGALALSGLAMLNEMTTRERLREANWNQIANARNAEDALRNAEVIDAMGMLGPIVARWRMQSERVITDQEVASDRSGVIASTSRFVRLALQMGMLGLGAYLVLDRDMTPGGMIGGSLILARALSPIEQAILTWRQLIGARQAYQRLVTFFERDRLRERRTSLPVPNGRLDIERVVHAFPKAEHALLKGIGFSVPAGTSLALIGSSGSGKTTLARILVGVLKPVSGVARLDGADVFSWSREDFGRHVGYLPQDVELFGGSIRENIARLADGREGSTARGLSRDDPAAARGLRHADRHRRQAPVGRPAPAHRARARAVPGASARGARRAERQSRFGG